MQNDMNNNGPGLADPDLLKKLGRTPTPIVDYVIDENKVLDSLDELQKQFIPLLAEAIIDKHWEHMGTYAQTLQFIDSIGAVFAKNYKRPKVGR